MGIDAPVLDLGIIICGTLAFGRPQHVLKLLFGPDTDASLAEQAALLLELGDKRRSLGGCLR